MLCLKKGKKIRPMPRKAHEFRDFRGYLNWSYTPEKTPDFQRNQVFLLLFSDAADVMLFYHVVQRNEKIRVIFMTRIFSLIGSGNAEIS